MLFSFFIFIMTSEPLSKLFTRLIISSYFTASIAVPTPDGKTNSSSPQLTGSFNYASSQNFDAYLKGLGVPYILRTLAGLASPTLIITQNCQQEDKCLWKIRTDTAFRSHEAIFHLGEEAETTRMDGQYIRYVVTKVNDNQLLENQTHLDGSGIFTTILRDFSDRSKMVVTLKVNNVTATSLFYRDTSYPS